MPVYSVREILIHEIKKNPSTVIVGETGLYLFFLTIINHKNSQNKSGSGKTTQIPQFIFQSLDKQQKYHGRPSGVAVTQPRRIAAISVAQRVAEEMNCSPVGGLVGYHVRFDKKTSDNTRVTFLTDGIKLLFFLSKNISRT